MKIGILGTGIMGTTIASHLLKKGHEVMIGSRMVGNKKLNSTEALQGNFFDAVVYGSIVFHCVMGIHSLDAAMLAGKENFKGKIVIDVTNPLDFSLGMPPRLTICNDSSAGEQLQELLPQAYIVKGFNTVPYAVITNPSKTNNKNVDMFICGNDYTAKQQVTEMIVKEFDWNRENVIDLGEIKHARSTEALMLFFCSVAMQSGTFNNMIKVYRS